MFGNSITYNTVKFNKIQYNTVDLYTPLIVLKVFLGTKFNRSPTTHRLLTSYSAGDLRDLS